MKLHHFFISEKIGDDKVGRELLIADPTLMHQLKNVFRFGQGDQVILCDNSGFQYVSRIVDLEKNEGRFFIEGHRKSANNADVLKTRIVLLQSLIKKDKFEWIIQKDTELGVMSFIPVLSERSEKKDINPERLCKIIKEASEQSERGTLPEFHEVKTLSDIFDGGTFERETVFLAFDPKGQTLTFLERSAIIDEANGVNEANKTNKMNKAKRQIGILIGPEGGWTDKELEFFHSKGVKVYSLGVQVLRAETAAVSAAALFLFGLIE